MSVESDGFPVVMPGQRATLVGRTGSGKTTVGRWLLRRSPGTWIILNTKGDKSFAELPSSISVQTFDLNLIAVHFQTHKFIVVNPPDDLNNPDGNDAFIQLVQRSFEGIGLMVDELYQTQKNGQAGPGVIGWLTRGRSLNQSFIGCTQRPAWISRFCFSEADFYCVLTLTMAEDRKRVYEFIGDERVLENPPNKFEWRWYSVADDRLELFAPVSGV